MIIWFSLWKRTEIFPRWYTIRKKSSTKALYSTMNAIKKFKVWHYKIRKEHHKKVHNWKFETKRATVSFKMIRGSVLSSVYSCSLNCDTLHRPGRMINNSKSSKWYWENKCGRKKNIPIKKTEVKLYAKSIFVPFNFFLFMFCGEILVASF